MILGNVVDADVSLLGQVDAKSEAKAAVRHVRFKINEAEQRYAMNDCAGGLGALQDAWESYGTLLGLRRAAGLRVQDGTTMPLLKDIARLRVKFQSRCLR